jgi:hypothetical protein
VVDKKDEEWKRARLLAEALSETDRPRPPKAWWDEHRQRIREQHPEYTDEQVNRAVGAIWWKKYKAEKRRAAVLAEALAET